jgi:hydroxyacylglutathione hydrolase
MPCDQLRARHLEGDRKDITPGIRSIRLGGVNCYLVVAGDGFVLIDTGTPEKREALDAELARAGCRPGTLRLVVHTHGDYDHAGNAAYLRDKYATKIAMHRDDSGRVERADWT